MAQYCINQYMIFMTWSLPPPFFCSAGTGNPDRKLNNRTFLLGRAAQETSWHKFAKVHSRHFKWQLVVMFRQSRRLDPFFNLNDKNNFWRQTNTSINSCKSWWEMTRNMTVCSLHQSAETAASRNIYHFCCLDSKSYRLVTPLPVFSKWIPCRLCVSFSTNWTQWAFYFYRWDLRSKMERTREVLEHETGATTSLLISE